MTATVHQLRRAAVDSAPDDLVPSIPLEELRDWVARSRGEQGLPATIQHPPTLAKAAVLMVRIHDTQDTQQAQGAGSAHGRGTSTAPRTRRSS